MSFTTGSVPANAIQQTSWFFGTNDNIFTNTTALWTFAPLNTSQNSLTFPIKSGKKYLIEISSNFMSQNAVAEFDIGAQINDGQTITTINGNNTNTVNSNQGTSMKGSYMYTAKLTTTATLTAGVGGGAQTTIRTQGFYMKVLQVN